MGDYDYIIDELYVDNFLEYLNSAIIDGDDLYYNSVEEFAQNILFNYILDTFSVDRRFENEIWNMIENEEIFYTEDLTRYTSLLINNRNGGFN